MKRFKENDKVIYTGRARGFDNGDGAQRVIWSGHRGVVRSVSGDTVQVECVIHGERTDFLMDAVDLKLEVFRARGTPAPEAQGFWNTLMGYLHG